MQHVFIMLVLARKQINKYKVVSTRLIKMSLSIRLIIKCSKNFQLHIAATFDIRPIGEKGFAEPLFIVEEATSINLSKIQDPDS